MNLALAAEKIRTRQAQARIQAETENVRTAVRLAARDGNPDRWHLYLSKELQTCYGQRDASPVETTFATHFNLKHGIKT